MGAYRNEQCALKLLALLNANCPCGGHFNDYHSHASDCVFIGGRVEYEFAGDQETPHQRNRKIVHDIKGKLSPVSHLIWMVKSQYDDELSDDIGGKGHRAIQDMMEDSVKNADEYFRKCVELLDEIE